jgi:hypothetical protein
MHYTNGKRLSDNSFIKIGLLSSPEQVVLVFILNLIFNLCNSLNLRIDDQNAKLICVIIRTMPDNIRMSLVNNFETVFGRLRQLNSASEGESFRYPAIHFDWYNRHSARVRNHSSCL